MCGGYCQLQMWFVMGVTRYTHWMDCAHRNAAGMPLCMEIIDIGDLNKDEDVSLMDKGKG